MTDSKQQAVNMVIQAWRLYAESKPFSSRIEQWQKVVERCDASIARTTDQHVRTFNEAIKRIAELELLAAVRAKMEDQ